ncbi:hypothetical protein HG535_0F05240 [Zygotorulaspora mrakii]|uniref:Uncharacterized protein n=1 Tax=Zygotorulaspora mrakii TaxID=42260 RepID=A0A7H9B8F8_ZYGMR|nr:uncharacterized protein HG535_0F05240 [Zygotorulaspora mrakii]QLG74012.1 hypothetical protein HG535_0F05240 [Zygotorulaspora mrakii]
MFLHSIAATLFLLDVIRQSSASKLSFTLTTEELGGDSTDSAAVRPLVVHVDKKNMSPEILKQLYRTSNIIFADFPEVPEFINLKEYENMKSATEELLDQLTNERNIALENVKKNEKFSEIETLLQEIIDQEDLEKKNAGEELFWGTGISTAAVVNVTNPPATNAQPSQMQSQVSLSKSIHPQSSHSASSRTKVVSSSSHSTSTYMHPTIAPIQSMTEHPKSSKISSYSSELRTSHGYNSSSSWFKNVTSTSYQTSSGSFVMKPSRSSGTFTSGSWKVHGNFVNATANALNNGSTFVMPTTFIMALLLSAILFALSY